MHQFDFQEITQTESLYTKYFRFMFYPLEIKSHYYLIEQLTSHPMTKSHHCITIIFVICQLPAYIERIPNNVLNCFIIHNENVSDNKIKVWSCTNICK